MNNIILYLITVLIWGTTWYGIKLQVGHAPVEISIFYRFLIASSLLFLWCKYENISLKMSFFDHLFCCLLGFTMFSIHYLFVYEASFYIASGIIAVIFSGVSFCSIFYNALFFRVRPQMNVILGAMMGIAGLGVFFWDEISQLSFESHFMTGLILSLIGVAIFALGSVIMKRNQRQGLRNTSSMSVAMIYGAITMLIYIVTKGISLSLPSSTIYWSSLFYLAIPGSIIAFLCYFQLIRNVGPELAGYTTVVVPILSLLISWVFEGYQFSLYDMCGLVLVITGNVLVLRKKNELKKLTPIKSFKTMY